MHNHKFISSDTGDSEAFKNTYLTMLTLLHKFSQYTDSVNVGKV